jgi:hypothetical protein
MNRRRRDRPGAGRSGRRSSPWSRRPRNPSRTSRPRRPTHRLPTGPAAASWSRTPDRSASRSTAARSVIRSVPTKVSSPSPSTFFQPVFMSSRLTKKSLVSWPGRSVRRRARSAVVGAQHAQAADQHRHLRRRQAQKLGPVDQQFLGRDAEPHLQIVAETVGRGSRTAKPSTSVCFGRGVGAARGEGDLDRMARRLRRLFDADRAAQHDQVGDGDVAGPRR